MAVAYGAAGTIVYSNGNPAPSYPSGGTASRKYGYVLYAATSPDSAPANQALLESAGWTFLGAFNGGNVASGNAVGARRLGVYYRVSSSILTGSQTVTVTGNSVTGAWIERWECLTTEQFDFAITGGVDTTTGTPYSVVTASVPAGFVKTGDGLSVVTVTAQATNPTWGTPTLTAQGGGTISLGTVTSRVTITSTTGNDIGGRSVSAMPTVTSQLAGTLTWSVAVSGTTTAVQGPTAILRVGLLTAPSAPTTAPTVAAQAEQIAVTTPPTLEGGATSYTIYRGGVSIATGRGANTVYTDTLQDPTSARTYTVRGVNAAGSSTDSPASASVVPNPGPVITFSAVGGDDSVVFTVTKRFYAATYKFYRGPAGGARSLITSVPETASGVFNWTDDTAQNGVAYDYSIVTSVTTPTARDSAHSELRTVTPAQPLRVTMIYTGTGLSTRDSNLRIALEGNGAAVTTRHESTQPPHPSLVDVVVLGETATSVSWPKYVAWPGPVVLIEEAWAEMNLAHSNPPALVAGDSQIQLDVNWGPNGNHAGGGDPVFTAFTGSPSLYPNDIFNLPVTGTAMATSSTNTDSVYGIAFEKGALGADGVSALPARRVALGIRPGLSVMTAAGKAWVSDVVTWASQDTTWPPPSPPTDELTDDFSTENTSVWSGYEDAGIYVSGGELYIDPSTYRTLSTVDTFTLKDSELMIKLVERPVQGMDGSVEATIQFRVDTYNHVTIGVQDSNFQIVETVDNALWSNNVAHDSTHKWLRVRHADDTLYWESSPDGTTWTDRGSHATAKGHLWDHGTVRITAGNDGEVAPGMSRWDNLNLVPSGPPKVSDLADGFATEDTTKWTGYAAAEVSAAGGALNIDATFDYPYPGLTSATDYDLEGSQMVIGLLQRPNVADGSVDAIFRFEVEFELNYAMFLLRGTSLAFVECIDGTESSTQVAYNATTHKFWRLRHGAGNLYWDTSPDGSTWTNRRTLATSQDYSLGKVQILAGNDNDPPSPGTAIWDYLNVAPPPAYSGSLATSGGGSLSFGGNLIAIPTQTLATSGGGVLSLSGAPRTTGALATSGGGTLGLAGSPRVARSLATSGGGTLGLSGTPKMIDTPPLATGGSGVLSLSGVPKMIDTPPLATGGSGVLSLSGVPRPAGGLATAGSGVLSLAGAKVEAYAGALTTAGSGVLSLSGVARYSAALATSGGGVLGLSGVPSVARSLALSGGGSLTFAGAPSPVAGLALSGGGSLSLAGNVTVIAGLATAGSGVLSLAGVARPGGALTTSGGGSLALGATRVGAGGSLATSGGGVLGLAATIGVGGALATSGSGVLQLGAARAGAGGLLALAGGGALSLTADKVGAGGLLATAGGGSLSLTGGGVAVGGSLTTSGSGLLTLAALPSVAGGLPLSGAGALSLEATQTVAGGLTLAGGGALSLSGQLGAVAALTLAGSGLLTLAAVPRPAGTLATSGSGVLSLAADRAGARGSLATAGGGVLALSAQGAGVGILPLGGSGLLTLAVVPRVARTLTLAGSGVLTLAAVPRVARTLATAGSGLLSLAGAPRVARTLATSGSGLLSLAGSSRIAQPLATSGSGLLALSAGPPALRAALATSGSGELSLASASSGGGQLDTAGGGVLTFAGRPAAGGTLTTSGGGSMTMTGRPGGAGVLGLTGGGSLSFPGGHVGAGGGLELEGGGSLALTQPIIGAGLTLALDGSGWVDLSGQPGAADSFVLSGSGELNLDGQGFLGPRYPGAHIPVGRVTTPTARGTVRPAGSGAILAPSAVTSRIRPSHSAGTIRRAP